MSKYKIQLYLVNLTKILDSRTTGLISNGYAISTYSYAGIVKDIVSKKDDKYISLLTGIKYIEDRQDDRDRSLVHNNSGEYIMEKTKKLELFKQK